MDRCFPGLAEGLRNAHKLKGSLSDKASTRVRVQGPEAETTTNSPGENLCVTGLTGAGRWRLQKSSHDLSGNHVPKHGSRLAVRDETWRSEKHKCWILDLSLDEEDGRFPEWRKQKAWAAEDQEDGDTVMLLFDQIMELGLQAN